MTHYRSLPNDHMGIMLLLAAAIHIFLILGVQVDFSYRSKPKNRLESLEIIVVRQHTPPSKTDEKADYLAQISQVGSGESPKKVRPASVTPEQNPSPAYTPTNTPQDAPDPNEQKNKKPLIVQEKSSHEVYQEVQPDTQSAPKPTLSELFASKEAEIAHISAELDKRSQTYANLPRHKAINANTKEYKYAAYLDAWRQKVERIGNLNYPDDIKRKKLYGNLILHVAVKHDGSIYQVRVLRSSGYKLLDDAAVRIVHLAAPYSPFPKEIREETDILDITRTWRFRNDRLE